MKIGSNRTGLMILIAMTLCNSSTAQLSGTYSIGGIAPDYTTISAAVNDLIAQGINGPVTFNIRSGTYTEQVTISEITGASAVNRITFQSETLDTASVHWKFQGPLSSQNFVIKLDGADFISVRYLSLSRIIVGSFGGRVITFENGACNDVIEFSHLQGKYFQSPTSYEAMYSPNTIDTGTTISHNTIERAGCAVYFSGQDTLHEESGNIIDGNTISNSFSGIFEQYQKNTVVSKNNISVDGTNSMCIAISYSKGNVHVLSNTLYSYIGGGVSIFDCYPPSGDTTAVVNNMIRNGGTEGISVYQSSDTWVFNNSIRTFGNYLTYGVYFGYCTVILHNNILSHFNNGVTMVQNYANAISDYNEFYTAGATLVKFESFNYATLTDWQTAFLQDSHSNSSKPLFVSTSDLHIHADIDLDSKGIEVGVMTDIDGDMRSSPPDIGADEFVQPGYDAGILAVVNPETRTCAGATDILVNFRNYGAQLLTSLTLEWEVNGILQPSVYWTGSIATGDTATNISLGIFDIIQDSIYQFKAWTNSPDGIGDSNNVNDTLQNASIKTKMKGNYTIGGANPDFASFTQSVAALLDRQVCGNVIFNARPGIYNEVFSIPTIVGASDSSTVTWQSEDLDTASVILSYSDNGFGPDLIIGLGSTSHLRFRYLTIRRDLYIAYPSRNDLIGCTTDSKIHDIIIEHCHLQTPHLTYGGVHIQLSDAYNIAIKDNTFDGGEWGAWVGSFPWFPHSNIVIENNRFNNITEKSIWVLNEDSLIIRNNIIYNDTMVIPIGENGVIGLQVDSADNDLQIYDNKFEGRFAFGAIINSCRAPVTAPNYIYNNFFSCVAGDFNASIAIYITHCDNLNFFHNNVKMSNFLPAGNTVYNYVSLLYSCTNLIIMNNVFSGDSANTIFYLDGPYGPILAFDYNDIFRHDTTTQFASVPGWPWSFNANSIYVDPEFYSTSDLHVQNLALAGAGASLNIASDIDQQPRNSPPAIGADEIMPFDISPVSPMAQPYQCDSLILMVNIQNLGIDTIHYFDLHWNVPGLSFGTIHWSGILLSGDTLMGIKLDTVSFTEGINYQYSVTTSAPDSNADMQLLNDSAEINFSFSNIVAFVDLGNDTTICPALAFSLHAGNNFEEYLWSTGATTSSIPVTGSGTYTVTVINSAGCTASDSVFVNFFSVIEPLISQSNDTLYSSSASGNQWYKNGALLPGATYPYYVPLISANYTVAVTDSNGCKTFSNPLYFIVTSVPQLISGNDEISIFPNPSQGTLFIKSSVELIDHCFLSDVLGRRMGFVSFKEAPTHNYVLDLSILSNGIYLLTMNLGQRIITSKIIISK